MALISRRILIGGLAAALAAVLAAQDAKKPTSYAPVAIPEDFNTIMNRMSAAKPEIMKRHLALLEQLTNDVEDQAVDLLGDLQ